MKMPTFVHGALAAAMLAFSASVLIAFVTPFVGFNDVVRFAIPALAFGYLLYLFRSNDERTGRLTTVSLWSAMAFSAWWLHLPLSFYLLLHVGAIWFIRSLYFHTGVLPSLIDLALSAFSIAAFGWALEHTGSIFLSVWCFFLVQALFIAIPQLSKSARSRVLKHGDNDTFERARRQAERALQQLYTNQ